MGIWDAGSFDNDCAFDWTVGLGIQGIQMVRSALDIAPGYVEIDVAQHAIAAAEVVAAAHGSVAEDLPAEVSVWVAVHRAEFENADIDSAISAVLRVQSDSELREVWEAGPRYDRWVHATETLIKRLQDRKCDL